RRGLAEAEGPRHVGEAAGGGVAREEVDDDGLALGDRAVALLVPDRALRAVGNDRHLLGQNALPSEHVEHTALEMLAHDARAATKAFAHSVHRPLGGALSPADALELDGRLRAPAI